MSYDLITIIASSNFQTYFRHFGYIGIYVWFITVDQIAPLPEEITLIVIGYFASQGYINPILAGVFSIVAFITIDTIYFYLTKSGNKLVNKIKHRSESTKVKKYKDKLKDHTFKTLLILCFIPRMRLLGPVFVALLKIPYRKFILYDALGLSVFTTVYISLGLLFHKSLSMLVSKAESIGNIIFIAAMIFMTIVSVIIIRRFK